MHRIVSMISSATEIVDGLGALGWLVGRSHECDYPEAVRALPVCTAPRFAVDGDSREIDRLVRRSMAESISVYRVFDEVLERLQPTGPRPRLACIEWIEPLMPTANWMPELIEMAGAENVVWRTWEDLAAADPDVILVMPCGFDLARAVGEMHWLTGRAGWGGLRAVRNGRVYAADGNQYFNRPGPRLVESLAILAAIAHPENCPAPDARDACRAV